MDDKNGIPKSMNRIFDRSIEANDNFQISSMALMLFTIPRPIDLVDVFVVLPGMGEEWRLIQAIQAWDSSLTARYLLITGVYGGEGTYVLNTMERLMAPPFNLKRLDGVVIQPDGLDVHHTGDQTKWIIAQINVLNITSLALCVSPYHLLRAYGTLLKAFGKFNQRQIPIIPMPVVMSPDVIIPETGIDAWEMFHGEVARILKYQEMGDVATYDELKIFISWLWCQPIING